MQLIRKEPERSPSVTSSLLSEGTAAYDPFSIEPPVGTILPGKSQVFKVKFSPLDVNEYEARLVCS